MNAKDEFFMLSQFFYGMICCVVLLIGINAAQEEDRKLYSGSIVYAMLTFATIWGIYWYLNNNDAFLLFSSAVGWLVSVFSLAMIRIYAQTAVPKCAPILSTVMVLTSIVLFLCDQEFYLGVLGDISLLLLVITPLIDEYPTLFSVAPIPSVPLSLKIFLCGYTISWECYRLILSYSALKTVLLTLASILATIQLIVALHYLYQSSLMFQYRLSYNVFAP
jgi:hypothetical protein